MDEGQDDGVTAPAPVATDPGAAPTDPLLDGPVTHERWFDLGQDSGAGGTSIGRWIEVYCSYHGDVKYCCEWVNGEGGATNCDWYPS